MKVAGVAVEIDTTLLLSLAADARPLWQGETPQTGPCLGVQCRCLDKQGKIVWKASPRFLTMLADAERDAEDDLADFP